MTTRTRKAPHHHRHTRNNLKATHACRIDRRQEHPHITARLTTWKRRKQCEVVLQGDTLKKEVTTMPPSSARPRRSKLSIHHKSLEAANNAPNMVSCERSISIVSTSIHQARLSLKTSEPNSTPQTAANSMRSRAMEKAAKNSSSENNNHSVTRFMDVLVFKCHRHYSLRP